MCLCTHRASKVRGRGLESGRPRETLLALSQGQGELRRAEPPEAGTAGRELSLGLQKEGPADTRET
jgi:hypothetical protein